MSIYLNGLKQDCIISADQLTTESILVTDNFNVGRSYLDTLRYFDGNISKAAVYPYVLPQDKVVDHYYTAHLWHPTVFYRHSQEILTWLPMNESSGTTLNDGRGSKDFALSGTGYGVGEPSVLPADLDSSGGSVYFGGGAYTGVASLSDTSLAGIFGSGGGIEFVIKPLSDGGGGSGRIIDCGNLYLIYAKGTGDFLDLYLEHGFSTTKGQPCVDFI
jgi:hypothetical protein